MTRGRPLRFLVLVLGGWVVIRAAMLLPGEMPPGRSAAARAPAVAAATVGAASAAPSADDFDGSVPLPSSNSRSADAQLAATRRRTSPATAWHVVPGLLRGGAEPIGGTFLPPDAETGSAHDPALDDADRGRSGSSGDLNIGVTPGTAIIGHASRLRGDTWLIARPTGGDNLAFGQLGASQAGMRLTYKVSERRRIALSGRVSAPLRGIGREAALGVDWQPTRLPVHLLAEQRLPLDGGRARPAVQLIGGGAMRLPLGLAAEGYAQAGGVWRRGGFADGSARVSHGLLARSVLRVDLGGGSWGAIQRGVARVDLGPTLGLTLPAQGGTVRLAVDYRLRVAGRARPGSGPAVSVGSSF